MKFLILSDLHIEHASFTVPADVAFDAVILAGDIHAPGHRAVHWARRESVFGTDKPVILVPGNHEFYGTCLDTELQEMRKAAQGSNVHVLSRDELVLDDPAGGRVRILGCTLWTDFLLPIGSDGERVEDVERALASANRLLNDYRCIEVAFHKTPAGDPMRFKRHKRLLTAEDTLAMHWVDRSWLTRALATPFDGATVVVTHHAPSAGSVHPQHGGDHLTPSFVSDLPGELFLHPFAEVLWVHGHTHASADYQRKTTRVLSNPRGYPVRTGVFENPDFDPRLIVDVRTDAGQKTDAGSSLRALRGAFKAGPDVQVPASVEKLSFPRREPKAPSGHDGEAKPRHQGESE